MGSSSSDLEEDVISGQAVSLSLCVRDVWAQQGPLQTTFRERWSRSAECHAPVTLGTATNPSSFTLVSSTRPPRSAPTVSSSVTCCCRWNVHLVSFADRAPWVTPGRRVAVMMKTRHVPVGTPMSVARRISSSAPTSGSPEVPPATPKFCRNRNRPGAPGADVVREKRRRRPSFRNPAGRRSPRSCRYRTFCKRCL